MTSSVPELTPSAEAAQGPLILIADDDQAIRALFRTALEREGFSVLIASNGRRAMQLVRSAPVAVMLLDLNMPGVDGIATLRELRADPGLRTLPVILVTGSTTEADRIIGLDRGADDVVVKPVSVAELVARVRAQIRGREALTREQEASRKYRRRLAAFLPE